MSAIDLTAEEKLLAVQIDFEGPGTHGDEPWETTANAMEALMRSLIERDAIPEQRRKFFEDPEYFIGGRGKSHLQVFEGNGKRGVDIFRDGNFVKYLRYFIYGPVLPRTVIEAFEKKVRSCGNHFNGTDALDVATFARRLARAEGLTKWNDPEEFYKLALDCDLDPDDAKTIRDAVKQAAR